MRLILWFDKRDTERCCSFHFYQLGWEIAWHRMHFVIKDTGDILEVWKPFKTNSRALHSIVTFSKNRLILLPPGIACNGVGNPPRFCLTWWFYTITMTDRPVFMPFQYFRNSKFLLTVCHVIKFEGTVRRKSRITLHNLIDQSGNRYSVEYLIVVFIIIVIICSLQAITLLMAENLCWRTNVIWTFPSTRGVFSNLFWVNSIEYTLPGRLGLYTSVFCSHLGPPSSAFLVLDI